MLIVVGWRNSAWSLQGSPLEHFWCISQKVIRKLNSAHTVCLYPPFTYLHDLFHQIFKAFSQKKLLDQIDKSLSDKLKGNSRLILTIFCIDANIRWINFTAIIYVVDEWFYEKNRSKPSDCTRHVPFHRGSSNGQRIKTWRQIVMRRSSLWDV